jgi:hypothetical protein
MFLLHTATGNLMRVEDLDELFNPSRSSVLGRDQAGEEEQEPAWFSKNELVFTSGEPLPSCWVEVNYRHCRESAHRQSASEPASPVEMEI